MCNDVHILPCQADGSARITTNDRARAFAVGGAKGAGGVEQSVGEAGNIGRYERYLGRWDLQMRTAAELTSGSASSLGYGGNLVAPAAG
jgi:hypothetical protein